MVQRGDSLPARGPLRRLLVSVKKPTLLEWLVILAVVAVLVALLLPRVRQAVNRARSARCRENLALIGLGLHTYHDDHERLPPASVRDAEGRALHSWRVLILPYLDQHEVYVRYWQDEPWDGPLNAELHEITLDVYQCRPMRDPPSTETNYLAVVGTESAWHPTRGRELSEFTDGTSQTLLVVEAHHTGIHWMAPNDLSLDSLPPTVNPPLGLGFSSEHKGGAHALLVDGSVRFIPSSIAPEKLRALFTIAGDQLPPDDDF